MLRKATIIPWKKKKKNQNYMFNIDIIILCTYVHVYILVKSTQCKLNNRCPLLNTTKLQR